MTCDKGSVISIEDVQFGPSIYESEMGKFDCLFDELISTMSNIKRLCNDHNSCILNNRGDNFTFSCGPLPRLAKVTYRCGKLLCQYIYTDKCTLITVKYPVNIVYESKIAADEQADNTRVGLKSFHLRSITVTNINWLIATQCPSGCTVTITFCPVHLLYDIYWNLIITLRNKEGVTCEDGTGYPFGVSMFTPGSQRGSLSVLLTLFCLIIIFRSAIRSNLNGNYYHSNQNVWFFRSAIVITIQIRTYVFFSFSHCNYHSNQNICLFFVRSL